MPSPQSTVASQAESQYTPEQPSRRKGRAICLSGGGYRAALFHLGALTRLNELGALSGIDMITSVSGGSIIAAHLATRIGNWPTSGSVPDWEMTVAEPFREFARRNIRTFPALARWLPWNWFNPGASARALQSQYQKHLTNRTIADLPDRPRFTFCATDMSFGVNWVFEHCRAGDYQAGYVPATVCGPWPLSAAVGASSCFPPVFKPLPMGLDPATLTGGACASADRDGLCRKLALTDGGVYDNMGLEPVWKSAKLILVSDGGAPFQFSRDTSDIGQLLRFPDIMGNQAGSVRKRWLIASFIAGQLDGTYWGIGSAAEDYKNAGVNGYSNALVKRYISTIRTDLDAFSEPEMFVLENHGYLLAEAAIRAHVPELHPPQRVPVKVPHEAWMDEKQVESALRDSGKRKIFGRW